MPSYVPALIAATRTGRSSATTRDSGLSWGLPLCVMIKAVGGSPPSAGGESFLRACGTVVLGDRWMARSWGSTNSGAAPTVSPSTISSVARRCASQRAMQLVVSRPR